MNTQSYPEGGLDVVQARDDQAGSLDSLLVADCGAVYTKVSLFGIVEGQYRLLARGEAPSSINPPYEDITEGILQAIQMIEFITGRRLIEEKRIISPEQSNGDGVDAFLATISAGEPLRLAVLGAVSQNLENLVAQALSGLYVQAQSVPSPSYIAATMLVSASGVSGVGTATAGQQWTRERLAQEWERQLGHLGEIHAQAALIVGMADGPAGPTPLQEACQLLINAFRNGLIPTAAEDEQGNKQGRLFPIVYAGAPQYVEAVRRMVQGVAEVTRVDPMVSAEQLVPTSTAVGALHERDVLRHLPGYERLQSWSNTMPIASATSLSSLVRFLAQHYSMNVAAVDIGGSTTTLMLASEQGEFIPMVNTDIGIGAHINTVLQRAGLPRITRWLPFGITEEEVRQFALNHMLHPDIQPIDSRELLLLQAFTREAIMLALDYATRYAIDLPDTDLILATGGILAHAPKYGQVALMLLDALQPRGVTSLVLDSTMLTPQLGAVATVAPVTAVQVNENDAVSHRLGTCVIPFGNIQPGQLAVRVGVEYTNGRQLNFDVMGGTIEVIPLQLNEQALITLFPAPTVDVGLGPGERARAAEEIDGGLVGLIVDARGRPLNLPTDDAERQARLLQWSQSLGAE